MPRPKGLSSRPKKKAKLEPTETERSEPVEIICNEDGQLDDIAPENVDKDHATVRESPGALKRAAAAQVHSEAAEHTAMMRGVEKRFMEEEARVKRVVDERERRLLTMCTSPSASAASRPCGTECAGGSRILLSSKRHS